MGPDQQRLSPTERADLVAYLDGELGDGESQAIATKLSRSATARREVEALEKTWDLLDYLPRPRASSDFTARTLTEVLRQDAAGDRLPPAALRMLRRVLWGLGWATLSMLAFGVGYALLLWAWPSPSERLTRDLPIAEHLDEYREVGSFEFLQVLVNSPEFNSAGVPAAKAMANADRLRSMPLERRLALWEKLKEFDALPPDEKPAIRTLDHEIARLSPPDQASYASVLRDYHQWVQGLSEEQRNELNAGDRKHRMEVVSKLHSQERTSPKGQDTPLFLQVFDFSTIAPFELAHRLRIWFALSPEEQAEIDRLESAAEQQKRLNEMGQHIKVRGLGRISKTEEDALLAKLEANPQFRNLPGNPLLKKADTVKNEKLRKRIASNYHFIEHPPAAVNPVNLMRFAAALPSWNRQQFDHLPPEEARRILTVLYRLVFPAPAEVPKVLSSKKSALLPAAKAP